MTPDWGEHPGYVTVRDIVTLYRTDAAAVYRLAYRFHWRKYRIDGALRYHRGDVNHTLTTRRTVGDLTTVGRMWEN